MIEVTWLFWLALCSSTALVLGAGFFFGVSASVRHLNRELKARADTGYMVIGRSTYRMVEITERREYGFPGPTPVKPNEAA